MNDLLKTSIEDIAFAQWSGITDCRNFVAEFLFDYPDFDELWTIDELTEALLKRV